MVTFVKDRNGSGLFYNPEENTKSYGMEQGQIVEITIPFTMYIRFHTAGATAIKLTSLNRTEFMAPAKSFADISKRMRLGVDDSKMHFEFEDGSNTKVKYIFVNMNQIKDADNVKELMMQLRYYFLNNQDIEQAYKEVLGTFDNVSKIQTDKDVKDKWSNMMYSPKFRLKFDTPDDKTAKLDTARQMILDSYDPKEIPENPVLPPFPLKKSSNKMTMGLILVLLIAAVAVAYLLKKEKKSKKNRIQTEQFGRYNRSYHRYY